MLTHNSSHVLGEQTNMIRAPIVTQPLLPSQLNEEQWVSNGSTLNQTILDRFPSWPTATMLPPFLWPLPP